MKLANRLLWLLFGAVISIIVYLGFYFAHCRAEICTWPQNARDGLFVVEVMIWVMFTIMIVFPPHDFLENKSKPD